MNSYMVFNVYMLNIYIEIIKKIYKRTISNLKKNLSILKGILYAVCSGYDSIVINKEKTKCILYISITLVNILLYLFHSAYILSI